MTFSCYNALDIVCAISVIIICMCLPGMEAKAVLSQSGLVHTTLAQIWFVCCC